MYKRSLKIRLPAGQTAFLWGPRKSGKSTYLRANFPDSVVYDFLKTDVFFALSKKPSRLREELIALKQSRQLVQPVILDEVQKVPAILDEVHWLIENEKMQFVLCGSSARKLKRGHGNLLGGRAWRYEMYPLTANEIPSFDLLRALNRGLLPSHYLAQEYRRTIKAYVQDYLKEEILEEGLTRNMPAFARFMDALGFSQGELVNYANIARDCGVDAKTVKGYYEILVDTLLGNFIYPFQTRSGRDQITKTPKFYLFDVGVAGYLARRSISEARGPDFGRALEHFILMELLAYRSYSEKDFAISFWRTKTGYEVDFILGDAQVAVEVKGSDRIDAVDLRPIKAFGEAHGTAKLWVVCNEPRRRVVGKVTIVPWHDFIQSLWRDELI